ncbi:SHD1 domain-containing protein [Planctomycetes bacterium K23_9]|uniref:SLA1 homology domain-containing protein n=1 Tax=Stieleria marina TaxID=1930275 RepID=A0A517NVN3_9BACT|nr:hypothetical protein K239x_31810 [Planctomycetes bacterium K23_9]
MNIRAALSCAIMVALCLAWLPTAQSTAAEPMRIWVDSSGRYSIEASLVRRDGQVVILRRKDGGESTMPIDRISKRDQDYLANYNDRRDALVSVPKATLTDTPDYQPLPRLDLPRSLTIASENSELQMGVVTETTASFDPPAPQTPDPSPDAPAFPLAEFSLDGVNTYDRCSQLVNVGTDRSPAIGMSITVGFVLSGSHSINRVVKFDLQSRTSSVIHQSEEALTLLDHHIRSKRSLVLVGHSPAGKGGRLAIATGWRADELEINYQRKLPTESQATQGIIGSQAHLRWARWIDEEHVIAIVDRSLMGWNLVSGDMTFRIDGIDPGSVPDLSGGRRQLAVPVAGGVLLVDSVEGKVLGRIASEPKIVPSVSFSSQSHALAVTSQRRMVVWDLASAAKAVQIDSKRSLGSGSATWIDSDLVMTSSGILYSLQRQSALWRYHLNGTRILSADGRLALFRKRPESALAIVDMPHDGAVEAMEWIDSHVSDSINSNWQLPGRSVWGSGSWSDRDVRIGTQSLRSLK